MNSRRLMGFPQSAAGHTLPHLGQLLLCITANLAARLPEWVNGRNRYRDSLYVLPAVLRKAASRGHAEWSVAKRRVPTGGRRARTGAIVLARVDSPGSNQR